MNETAIWGKQRVVERLTIANERAMKKETQ